MVTLNTDQILLLPGRTYTLDKIEIENYFVDFMILGQDEEIESIYFIAIRLQDQEHRDIRLNFVPISKEILLKDLYRENYVGDGKVSQAILNDAKKYWTANTYNNAKTVFSVPVKDIVLSFIKLLNQVKETQPIPQVLNITFIPKGH